jgi:anion-transporting  ArsA/GET3 family ATPase
MTADPQHPAQQLRDLVSHSEVIVCCGSGGVGKTTTAAVFAIEAARLGRTAVVVTIDPAKRLADALGLDALHNAPTVIDGPWPGRVAAMMLDTEATFNDLVRAYAGDDAQAEQILGNRFYRNIAGAMSGTQEYMASEKLYELHSSGEWDLVVVDTPPTRNALDFLDAPNRLARFLDHRLFRLVTAPGRGVLRAANAAAQGFLRSVGKVVGGDVIADALAFFAAFDGMEEGFKERARSVEQLLRADHTAFVLVASPRADTVAEAMFFAEQLTQHHIAVRGVVVNRTVPDPGPGDAAVERARAEAFAGTDIGDRYRMLRDVRRMADVESQQISGLEAHLSDAPLVRVPMLPIEVNDRAGLELFTDAVFDPT